MMKNMMDLTTPKKLLRSMRMMKIFRKRGIMKMMEQGLSRELRN